MMVLFLCANATTEKKKDSLGYFLLKCKYKHDRAYFLWAFSRVISQFFSELNNAYLQWKT